MSELHWPWLELGVLIPLLGALWVRLPRDPDVARTRCLIVAGLTLWSTTAAWRDFYLVFRNVGAAAHPFEAHDRWDVLSNMLGHDFLVMDELSAPLLPLVALLHFLTVLATLRTKVRRFSFASMLVAEAILLAALSCKEPWAVISLLALGTFPPYLELKSRRRPTRTFALHMGLFVVLLIGGQLLMEQTTQGSSTWSLGVALLMAAVLLRSGIVPVHCWMTDLFEHATFGTALLFVTPMAGAYAAIRLVLPVAPDWALQSIALVSLLTAVYAAGMALVQREARRFFCYLFLSHSSLVLVGLETVTPIGLTGALCVWLSVGLALAGFGLTLRSVESRMGRLSLADYHGLFEHIPLLGTLFLITGLASVGFPGTIGFVATELLVEGAVQVYPHVGVAVVFAAALNGIAVMQVYFRLFTGARHTASISLRSRPQERLAILVLAALILGGGLIPQPGISSRHHAAVEIIRTRSTGPTEPAQHSAPDATPRSARR